MKHLTHSPLFFPIWLKITFKLKSLCCLSDWGSFHYLIEVKKNHCLFLLSHYTMCPCKCSYIIKNLPINLKAVLIKVIPTKKQWKQNVRNKVTGATPIPQKKKIKYVMSRRLCNEYSLEGLMLKLQYFGHLMRKADSFEKTLMLGKIEDRRTGWQRTRLLDGLTDFMEFKI